MEEEVLPGSGWRARVTWHSGAVDDTPVLCWVRTPHGMGPVIVIPGDVYGTTFTSEPVEGFLRNKGITSVRLHHPGVISGTSEGPGPYTLDSQPYTDTGPR